MMWEDFDREWEALAEEVLMGMKEWRLAHPRATLREMEAALDERLARVRARMLQDMALASAAADLGQAGAQERAVCEQCGQPLEARGKETRQLRTHGDQALVLERSYGVCPQCGAGFFPPR